MTLLQLQPDNLLQQGRIKFDEKELIYLFNDYEKTDTYYIVFQGAKLETRIKILEQIRV